MAMIFNPFSEAAVHKQSDDIRNNLYGTQFNLQISTDIMLLTNINGIKKRIFANPLSDLLSH